MPLPRYRPVPEHLKYRAPGVCEKVRNLVYASKLVMDLSSFVEINAFRTPKFDEYTYLMGRCYCSSDKEEIKKAAKALCWFTYRTNFPAIGGDGPTSDKGWGCMLRCGQMLMAEALKTVHVGRGWEWSPNSTDPNYRRTVRMFQDKRTSLFSIQQIAQMGVSEGKRMCEWFGPNTIAQCLKKLAIYDDWSQLVVHVAMDNLMIASDIKTLAATPYKDVTAPDEEKRHKPSDSPTNEPSNFRPVLILVPLRLGLTTINRAYLPSLQAFFKLPQCCGIVGGRPNHAVYFIGFSGEELYYLDPHTAQRTVDLDAKPSSSPVEDMVELRNEDLQEGPAKYDDDEPEVLATQEDIEDLEIEENSNSNDSSKKENTVEKEEVPEKKVEKTEENVDEKEEVAEEKVVKNDEEEETGSPSGSGGDCEPLEHEKALKYQEIDDAVEKDQFDDSTFHCDDLLYMHFDSLDPSLALGFICTCLDDFNDLIESLKNCVLPASTPPILEILDERPANWPKFIPYQGASDPIPVVDYEDFADPGFDSDDNFEILE
ncbi:unnamed protein product [Bursaphelenchus xylophilus]|uniref:Cysteine protease n=2 Tax=Bursaphelenchus xylophilus TaxID=6326 RepID=A0A1I7SA56_BURXY|nr:unnamed protein product [Bursaphelenchus xylophilus]CAG9131835.1 unnamed protein product [Bursaphelenchus xylophilus]